MSRTHEASPQGGHSYDGEISYGFLVKTLGATVVFLVLACAFIYWLYFFFLDLEKQADPAAPVLSEASLPIEVPGPKLLQLPERELDRNLSAAEKQLHSYGWVDEAAGIAHVPIDRALDLAVAQLAAASHDAAVTDEADSEETPNRTDAVPPTE